MANVGTTANENPIRDQHISRHIPGRLTVVDFNGIAGAVVIWPLLRVQLHENSDLWMRHMSAARVCVCVCVRNGHAIFNVHKLQWRFISVASARNSGLNHYFAYDVLMNMVNKT